MNNLKTKENDVKAVASSTETATVVKNGNSTEAKNQQLQGKKEQITKLLTPTTAEQRIKNHSLFSKMVEKHGFLTEKADSLNAYTVGRDGMKEKLVIKSDSGMSFEISNSNIIEEILILCASKLDEKLKESNNQILAFEI
ncbi:hypothetical protein ACFO4P_17165 [Epilithonimonas pallida]|uniref:Uncharacterized protein n=1 Tax=Epilithonimonas pallida TaxID=373671 RepID=A0ABY1R410_9FLAO|nr:hypothetical protein [Epilithonimonas pallida]SMP94721.1 hypothetical protein SAMN05421679_106119 [Epilithonimonas pallida]